MTVWQPVLSFELAFKTDVATVGCASGRLSMNGRSRTGCSRLVVAGCTLGDMTPKSCRWRRANVFDRRDGAERVLSAKNRPWWVRECGHSNVEFVRTRDVRISTHEQ